MIGFLGGIMGDNWGAKFFMGIESRKKEKQIQDNIIDAGFWFDVWNNDVYSIEYDNKAKEIIIYHWKNTQAFFTRSKNCSYEIYLQLLNEFKQKIGESK